MNKVGLFIDTWYPMVDGVIKVVDNYARRLMRYCDVVVFCPETRGFRKEDDAALPYQVVRCSSVPLIGNDYDIPTPALDPVFEARILRSGIDLVHIHSPFALGLSGVLYAKMRHLPVVATLHSQYRQDFEKPLKIKGAVDLAMEGVMRVFNACDECWAVNAGIKDLYVDEYGLTAPCKVRLNATDHVPVSDPARAAAIVNETYGIPADAMVFLFVGRINFIKNIDFIVRSLARAKEMGLENFRMLFVGKGQDEEKLAALVKELGLGGEVKPVFPGETVPVPVALRRQFSRTDRGCLPGNAHSLPGGRKNRRHGHAERQRLCLATRGNPLCADDPGHPVGPGRIRSRVRRRPLRPLSELGRRRRRRLRRLLHPHAEIGDTRSAGLPSACVCLRLPASCPA